MVCASGFKFVSGAITPQYTKAAHADRMGAGNIVAAISDHQTKRRRKIICGQNMGQKFRIMIQLTVWARAIDAIEEPGKLQMV